MLLLCLFLNQMCTLYRFDIPSPTSGIFPPILCRLFKCLLCLWCHASCELQQKKMSGYRDLFVIRCICNKCVMNCSRSQSQVKRPLQQRACVSLLDLLSTFWHLAHSMRCTAPRDITTGAIISATLSAATRCWRTAEQMLLEYPLPYATRISAPGATSEIAM